MHCNRHRQKYIEITLGTKRLKVIPFTCPCLSTAVMRFPTRGQCWKPENIWLLLHMLVNVVN